MPGVRDCSAGHSSGLPRSWGSTETPDLGLQGRICPFYLWGAAKIPPGAASQSSVTGDHSKTPGRGAGHCPRMGSALTEPGREFSPSPTQHTQTSWEQGQPLLHQCGVGGDSDTPAREN